MLNKKLLVGLIILLGVFITYFYSFMGLGIFIGSIVLLEVLSYGLVNILRKRSRLIITPKDEAPELSKEGLAKFFKSGYDPELGWIRKPNTSKKEHGKEGMSSYHINAKGSRLNPGHEELPSIISCYGSSSTFCRQVNDNETWPWFLSKLTKTNVVNFGVGNYGVGQALIRLKKEYKKNKTKTVLLAVPPATLVRMVSVWKHYHDFGNTFGFKPIFISENNKLKLIDNPINTQEKFFHYQDYLPEIKKNDYFYKNNFKKNIFQFSYLLSILSRPMNVVPLFLLAIISPSKSRKFKREDGSKVLNFLRKINLRFNVPTSVKLFRNKKVMDVFDMIIDEFISFGKKEGFKPIFVFMLQKEDVVYMNYNNDYFYKDFVERTKEKLFTIDLTDVFLKREDLDDLYTDDSLYGGHLSKAGNELVAKEIYSKLKGEIWEDHYLVENMRKV